MTSLKYLKIYILYSIFNFWKRTEPIFMTLNCDLFKNKEFSLQLKIQYGIGCVVLL